MILFMDTDLPSFVFRENSDIYLGLCYRKNQNVPAILNSMYMILTWHINIAFLGMKISPLIQCKSYNVSCGITILTDLSINMHLKSFKCMMLLIIQ